MQSNLFLLAEERPSSVQSAVDALATSSRAEERGAVSTRRRVVDFILDVAGYLPSKDLPSKRILEPSFGSGEFVCAAAGRLLQSYQDRGGELSAAYPKLSGALRGVELHRDSYDQTKQRVVALLAGKGLPEADAQRLADAWLIQDDFLLTDLPSTFTHVVGNPPYLRQESIPEPLIVAYRRQYDTIYDRADLYVPFIERSLRLLALDGNLTFICSDRWMKNRYGGPLRKLVADHYHLAAYVDMVDTPAFEGEVTAYPAIFSIARTAGSDTSVARQPALKPDNLRCLARAMRDGASGNGATDSSNRVDVARDIACGDEPWMLDSAEEVALLRTLESRLPLLEEVGCSVGIGVATGADSIFVRPMDELDVEASRQLPILKTADIRSGTVEWKGRGVLNPFEPDGSLASLEKYPRFAAYLRSHEERIKKRYVARKNPDRWYKTIDRIHPKLTTTPKLLIPDIKGAANVVYDKGEFYPHHNLYHVTAGAWDLRALQAVLRSAVAEFFVAMYAVKMRGGYLRFQAQYVRRIRLPRWEDVSPATRARLRKAAKADRDACDEVAFELYGLTAAEQKIIQASVYEAEHIS